MHKYKLLIGLIVLAYLLFVIFLFRGNELLANKFEVLILPIISLGYFLYVKPRIHYNNKPKVKLC